MSKIICDICGTTYPETAAQCPICGCAKNTTVQTSAGEQTGEDTSYAYVKGGRFSKTNVRKRYQPGGAPERRVAKESKPKNEGSNTNKILAVIIVLLLLAIAAVLVYIGLRTFFPGLGQPDETTPNYTQSTEETGTTESTEDSEPVTVPCTSLALSKTTIEFLKAGDGYLLAAIPAPVDTTDTITYTSSNEDVATVSESGMIKAVFGGQAVIVVTCGDQTAECQILCSFGDATVPTETTAPPATVPEGYVLKLRSKDFTMSTKYPGPEGLFVSNNYGVKATDITWTSDDTEVATVDENGIVTAVGRGNTVIRASIGDQTVTCKVNVAYDPKPATPAKYVLSHTDVTLYVNDSTYNSFRISLMTNDENKSNVEAEWTVSDEGYITINNRNVTAVKVTSDLPKRSVTITATVDGETYTCTVRVAEKQTEETE